MVDTSRIANGNGHATADPPIPGPLGIEAASLKGKVALVTGSGIVLFHLQSSISLC